MPRFRRRFRRPYFRRLMISRSKIGRLLISGLIFFVAFWLIVTILDSRLRPLISQLACARVNTLATAAINNAVAKRLDSGEYTYEKLISFEKDNTGQITALKTDMMTINRLKADITRDVLDAITGIGTSKLSIPLGNVTKWELLSGRGPKVNVSIVPVGTANASFSNVFNSAGINQTRHQIMMDVTAEISVLMPNYRETTTVTVQVNVAETVIVGSVPDSYTNFQGADEFFYNGKKYESVAP